MVPDFTASITAGCAPLGVSFRDLTTGNPKFWNWDFGNGSLSSVQNPTVTYGAPGTYTVTLVVRNPDGTKGITKTGFITVYPSPTIAFSSNLTIGCAPVNIQFADGSSPGSGTITAWQWDFGDGGTSTVKNPAHNYTATGFYNVTLAATSSSGCKAIATVNRYIRIVSGVKADFNNNKPVTCQPPYNITFANQSSGPGNMTFQWNLGNGTNSAQSSPATTYAATGTYNVTLTATSEFGCSNTITKPVALDGTSTSIKVPDSVCENTPILFENNSSIAPQKTNWEFGNGLQSTKTNDNTVYTAPGNYTVKLFNTYSSCKDSAVKVIYVKPSPVIDFKVLNAVACKPPLNVTFQDASPVPITKWEWDFGDGGTGTGSPVNHQYNSPGNFNVSAVFTDDKGCEGKISKPAVIQIVSPTVQIKNVPAGGCVPYTYTTDADVSAVDGVDTYTWDFGDGTVITGTDPKVSHLYTATGKYNITLTVTTKGGCTVTATEVDGVKVGTPPAASFSLSATDVCASEAVKFTDLTPQPVDEWSWNFGDGTTSPLQNPSHTFADSGNYVITLTAFNNRCPNTSSAQTVHIKPPIAKFIPHITCGNLTVTFEDKSHTDSHEAIGYTWEFGTPVPATNNTIGNTSFNFPAFNTPYPVTLTVTNGGCTNSYTETVNLVKQIADFKVAPTVCRGANFPVTSTNDPQFIKSYAWSIDPGTYTPADATYTANIPTVGPHSIGLTITDINGCTDTQVKPNIVTVVAPVANFTAGSPGGCKDAMITFNDQSTLSSAGSPITKWTFDFKDGNTQSFTTAPFTHTYADTGEYVPKLTIEDAMGCIDTSRLADTLFISTPQPWFYSNLTTICPQSDIQFTDSSTGKGLTYLWDFGNGGTTSTAKNPVFSYGGNDSSYSVKLVITDRGGCKDSVTRTNYITTIKPIPAFDILDTLTICPPIETKFTFKGLNYDSLEWDFGDGATSTLMNPTHFYNTYGNFTATLNIYGYGGCKESTSKNVHVLNPGSVTTLNYSPLEACNELLVDFSLVTIPDMKYALIFGDGAIDTTMATTYQHLYNAPALYNPTIQYTDNQGCIAGVGGGPPIKVIGADPFFDADKKKFCDSGTVYFTNYTIGNDPVVSRIWDFGDGTSTSSDTDPIHMYQQPGLYSVSQSVTTQQGCTKTIADTIRVFRTPDPYIAGDSIGCLNTTLNLEAMLTVPDTVITWKWDLGNNNFPTTQKVSLNFNNSGNYTVKLQATNSFGCTDTTSRNLYVPPTPAITVVNNPVIPVSTGTNLPITYGPEVVKYTWTPDKNLSCTDCPSPFANPRSTTTYTVKVADQYGCTNSADVTVTVVCNGLNYFIPNTFSPNGDGVNDVFAPRGVGLARVNSMRIFNRWGQMVFEKMNFMANDRTPNGGWDGTYKGKPASADVYVYIIEFVCENNAIVPVKGNVALVR
jgi:gliding motility-associated-like protein